MHEGLREPAQGFRFLAKPAEKSSANTGTARGANHSVAVGFSIDSFWYKALRSWKGGAKRGITQTCHVCKKQSTRTAGGKRDAKLGVSCCANLVWREESGHADTVLSEGRRLQPGGSSGPPSPKPSANSGPERTPLTQR